MCRDDLFTENESGASSAHVSADNTDDMLHFDNVIFHNGTARAGSVSLFSASALFQNCQFLHNNVIEFAGGIEVYTLRLQALLMLGEKLSRQTRNKPKNKITVDMIPTLIDPCIDGHLQLQSECMNKSVRILFTNLHWSIKEKNVLHFISVCLQRFFSSKRNGTNQEPSSMGTGKWTDCMPIRLFMLNNDGNHSAFADCNSPETATLIVQACHLQMLNDRLVYVDWHMSNKLITKFVRNQCDLHRRKKTNTLMICGLTRDTNEQDIFEGVQRVLDKKYNGRNSDESFGSVKDSPSIIDIRMVHSRRLDQSEDTSMMDDPSSFSSSSSSAISAVSSPSSMISGLTVLGVQSPGVCFVTLNNFEMVSVVCKQLQFKQLKNGSILHTFLSNPNRSQRKSAQSNSRDLVSSQSSHWISLVNVPWNVTEKQLRLLIRSVNEDSKHDNHQPSQIMIGEDTQGYSNHLAFINFETKHETDYIYQRLKDQFDDGTTLFMGRKLFVSVYSGDSDPKPNSPSPFQSVGSIVQSFAGSILSDHSGSVSNNDDPDSLSLSDTRLRLQKQAIFGYKASRRFRMVGEQKKYERFNRRNQTNALSFHDNSDVLGKYRLAELHLSRDRRQIERMASNSMIDTRILARMKNGETREQAMPLNRRQIRQRKRNKRGSIGIWTKFNMKKSVWNKLKDSRDWNSGKRVLPKYLAAKQTVRVKNYWNDSRKFQRKRSRNRDFIQKDRSKYRKESTRVSRVHKSAKRKNFKKVR